MSANCQMPPEGDICQLMSTVHQGDVRQYGPVYALYGPVYALFEPYLTQLELYLSHKWPKSSLIRGKYGSNRARYRAI